MPLKGLGHKRDKDGRIIFNDGDGERFVFDYDLELEDPKKSPKKK